MALRVFFLMQPVYCNSLLAQLPSIGICHLELRILKLHHHSEQLELGYVAASPDLDVNKVALSGFKLLASGYLEVLLSAILSFKSAA